MAEQETLRELDLSNKKDRKLLKHLIADKSKNRSYELMLESYRNIKRGSKDYKFTVMSDGTFRYNNETNETKLNNENLHNAVPRPQFSSPVFGESDINKYKVPVTYEEPKVKPEAKPEGRLVAKPGIKQGSKPNTGSERESSPKPTMSTKTDVKDKSSTGTKAGLTSNKSDSKPTVKSNNSNAKSSELNSSFKRPEWMSVMPLYSPHEYLNKVQEYLDTMHNSIPTTSPEDYINYHPRPMTSTGASIPIGTYNAVTPSQLTALPYFSSNTGVYLYSTNGPAQLFNSAMSEALRKVGVDPRNPSSVISLQQLLVNRGYLPKQLITGQIDDLTLQAFATYLAEMRSYKKGGTLKALQGTQLRLQNTQTPTLDAIMNNPLLVESFLLVLSQQLGKEISMEDLVTASQNPELAPQLEAIAQQVMKQSAALGAKLQYISRLRGKCPEGQELVYFAKGGKVCSACMGKKMEDGGEAGYMKSFRDKQKKKQMEKCGGKMKKGK